ncbi:hypothetical protein [Photobacterium kishitanii]|uniref:hypothetical protein n=1 Tax=Photobacterium kishitanii TaxID=318456 RepID=UPI002738FB60|nr:hypothetical protein [Photobacterium kishitanii]
MKPVITVVSAAVGLLLSSVTHAEEITMFDYEEATSAYQDACYLNAQFDLQSGNQDQTSFSTDASANYDQVFSSADRNTRINFVGDTSMSRGSNSDDTTKKLSGFSITDE